MNRPWRRLRGRIAADRARAAEMLSLKRALMARIARLLVMGLKLPISKEFLVLQCTEGSEASGLFSEFAAVLGLLEHYERWSSIYAGIRVDFGTKGLYYDPVAGENWWQYYFEPIELGSERHSTVRPVTPVQHDELALRAVPRRLASELVRRYVRVRPGILEKVETYAREHFGQSHMIGIHYRGTDKKRDLPLVPFEAVWSTVQGRIEAANGAPCRIFVATDEQAFLDFMLSRVPRGLLYRDLVRSTDGTPVHERDGDNHAKGEGALIDCLLLARTSCLIRTASNLGLCATFFNPELPEIVLSREG